jgi:glycosyltransferase involved in cell wall biosynthesis
VSQTIHRNELPITVLIAAKNEEANIARCLSALNRVERVVLLDSHSTDRTADIARTRGYEVIQFDYHGGYPKKRQWALDTLVITSDWVLLLDADEVVPADLWSEIEEAVKCPDAPDAFLITKGFHFLGRRFRFGGFSHSAVLLFRRGQARFEQLLDDPAGAQDMEVHERLVVDGRVGRLKTPLIHEDFKGLKAYIDRHNQYSSWEARLRHRYLSGGQYGQSTIRPRLFGNAQERRRFLKLIALRVPGEPLWWFLYHYVFRLGLLEGRPGWIASHIRASYIAQTRAKCFELACNARVTRTRPSAVEPAQSAAQPTT